MERCKRTHSRRRARFALHPRPGFGPAQDTDRHRADDDVGMGAILRQRFRPQRHAAIISPSCVHRRSPGHRSELPSHRIAVRQSRRRRRASASARRHNVSLGGRGKCEQAVGPAQRDGARVARDQQIGPRRASTRAAIPASIGNKPQPAPAPAPDRQPQAAQRHQHQRAQPEKPARRVTAPGRPRNQAAHRQHHIDAPAHQPAAAHASSPNGIAATLTAPPPASPQNPSPAWPADCPARRNGWRGRNENREGHGGEAADQAGHRDAAQIAVEAARAACSTRARPVPIPPPRSELATAAKDI